MSNPFKGKTVLLIRPERQQQPLKSVLIAGGAIVLEHPVIKIMPPESWVPLDNAITKINNYDWLIFNSQNGVEAFMERFTANIQIRPKIAAVGPGTASALVKHGFAESEISVPESDFSAEGLFELFSVEGIAGKRYLSLRANRGRDILKNLLVKNGGDIEEIAVYRSEDIQEANPEILDKMKNGQIDWIIVTSSAIAESLVRLFGKELRKSQLISISPITTRALCKCGFPPKKESKSATIESIVDSLDVFGLFRHPLLCTKNFALILAVSITEFCLLSS